MPIRTQNPANEEIVKEFTPLSDTEIKHKLDNSHAVFKDWSMTSLDERIALFRNLAKVLKENSNEWNKLIALEMGKPLKVGKGEIEKCAWNAEYFSENIKNFLEPDKVTTEFTESYMRFDPLGIILLVMPWNFPFWQVLRQAIPTIVAGNTVVLKHASNVPQCALMIEEAFRMAGFPENVFQTLLIDSASVEKVLEDFRVKGVSLTGSGGAGSSVASIAGKHLKRQVMELGGNDPFIVFADADLSKAVEACSAGRLNNSGQVCNSPKRVIVLKSVADEFITKLKENYESKKIGDPMMEDTDLGPLSSLKTLEEVHSQVTKSIEQGAKVITGAERIDTKGYYYKPTILVLNPGSDSSTLHEKDMPAYHDEIFGPVTSVIIVENEEEAVKVANDSKYGLGASIWTKDIESAKKYLPLINAGSVNINKNVSSDPRITIGGVNDSGYGRELSRYGLLEFVNIKSVVITE